MSTINGSYLFNINTNNYANKNGKAAKEALAKFEAADKAYKENPTEDGKQLVIDTYNAAVKQNAIPGDKNNPAKTIDEIEERMVNTDFLDINNNGKADKGEQITDRTNNGLDDEFVDMVTKQNAAGNKIYAKAMTDIVTKMQQEVENMQPGADKDAKQAELDKLCFALAKKNIHPIKDVYYTEKGRLTKVPDQKGVQIKGWELCTDGKGNYFLVNMAKPDRPTRRDPTTQKLIQTHSPQTIDINKPIVFRKDTRIVVPGGDSTKKPVEEKTKEGQCLVFNATTETDTTGTNKTVINTEKYIATTKKEKKQESNSTSGTADAKGVSGDTTKPVSDEDRLKKAADDVQEGTGAVAASSDEKNDTIDNKDGKINKDNKNITKPQNEYNKAIDKYNEELAKTPQDINAIQDAAEKVKILGKAIFNVKAQAIALENKDDKNPRYQYTMTNDGKIAGDKNKLTAEEQAYNTAIDNFNKNPSTKTAEAVANAFIILNNAINAKDSRIETVYPQKNPEDFSPEQKENVDKYNQAVADYAKAKTLNEKVAAEALILKCNEPFAKADALKKAEVAIKTQNSVNTLASEVDDAIGNWNKDTDNTMKGLDGGSGLDHKYNEAIDEYNKAMKNLEAARNNPKSTAKEVQDAVDILNTAYQKVVSVHKEITDITNQAVATSKKYESILNSDQISDRASDAAIKARNNVLEAQKKLETAIKNGEPEEIQAANNKLEDTYALYVAYKNKPETKIEKNKIIYEVAGEPIKLKTGGGKEVYAFETSKNMVIVGKKEDYAINMQTRIKERFGADYAYIEKDGRLYIYNKNQIV